MWGGRVSNQLSIYLLKDIEIDVLVERHGENHELNPLEEHLPVETVELVDSPSLCFFCHLPPMKPEPSRERKRSHPPIKHTHFARVIQVCGPPWGGPDLTVWYNVLDGTEQSQVVDESWGPPVPCRILLY